MLDVPRERMMEGLPPYRREPRGPFVCQRVASPREDRISGLSEALPNGRVIDGSLTGRSAGIHSRGVAWFHRTTGSSVLPAVVRLAAPWYSL